ncbi:MAG: hypothetical protein WEE89_09825 [Gemmatimonadota bacterium]
MNQIKRMIMAAALLALAATDAATAQKLQWSDVVYVPGRWQNRQLIAPAGKDTLALVMRVDYFANAPRWRAEIRRSTDGVDFGEPTLLLGDKKAVQVVTAVGATPLEQHVLASDSLVRAAIIFDAAGKRTGPASGAMVERAANGSVLRVTYRRPVSAPSFSDDNLNPRNRSAGRQIISNSLASVGNQRSASVVATAGARGVDRVKTARGEISVTPNPMAVAQMERIAVGTMKLEEFLRAGGLGPYKAGGTP